MRDNSHFINLIGVYGNHNLVSIGIGRVAHRVVDPGAVITTMI